MMKPNATGKTRILAITILFLTALMTADETERSISREDPMEHEAYAAMISRSLVRVGNNYRIKKAIDGSKSGMDLTVAFIGGSITEGLNASSPERCYAHLAYDEIRRRYGAGGGDNVAYLNAGMAGTPSTLGMIRYKRDVIDVLGRSPDIVFVEFAVNDGDDPTNGAAYESLVLDILQAESAPAVVLLFSVFQSRWNLQDRLIPIGLRYGLPMISVKDAVVPELESEKISDEEFFSDIYHPTDFGHRLMADCIANYLDAVDDALPSQSDAPIPESPVIGRQFAGIRMIDAEGVPRGVTIAPGSFSDNDTAIGTFGRDSPLPTFPANWHKAAGPGAQDFVMELTCRNLVIVYKKSPDADAFGMADAFVDGECIDSIDGAPGNGWNNPYCAVLIDDETAARHSVRISMDGDSRDKGFTIMAFGYTE